MRIRRALVLAAVAVLALVGLAAGPAGAIRDPFIVCVTEPCGPQLPWPPGP